MNGKKFWITETILTIISFILLFVVLSYHNNSDGHVGAEKRDNVLSNLNPINIISEKTVLEDSKGNLYIGNMAGDTLAIQKYTDQGMYVCSYYVDNKYRIYEFDENDMLSIYNSEKKYQYINDQLIGVTQPSDKEIFDSQYIEQQSDGNVIFWTVKLKNGRSIQLQKIVSLNMDYSNMLMFCVDLILLIAITSGELERAKKNIGVNEANKRDWETITKKHGKIIDENIKRSEKNMNQLLKKIQFKIYSNYLPEQIEMILKKQTMEKTNKLSFGINKNYPFYGTVMQNAFKVVLNTDSRNSFYPIIEGTFESRNDVEGSIINIKIQMSLMARVFNTVWIIIVLISGGVGIMQMFSGSPFSEYFPFISGSLAALLFEEAVSRIGFYKDSKIAIKKINQLFQ